MEELLLTIAPKEMTPTDAASPMEETSSTRTATQENSQPAQPTSPQPKQPIHVCNA